MKRGKSGGHYRAGPGEGHKAGGPRQRDAGKGRGPAKGRSGRNRKDGRQDQRDDRRQDKGVASGSRTGRGGERGPKRFVHGDRPRHTELGRRHAEPPRRAEPAPEPQPAFVENRTVQNVFVGADEHNMRVDRFFEARFPGLSFSHIQRIIRKGEVRVNGKRTEPKARLEKGQTVRIPPLKLEPPKPRDDAPQEQKDRAFLQSITLYEDDDVMVLNKPMGLAVQGGSGTTRHVDGMLESMRQSGRDGQRPRLVHRLDKDTAGCLLIAKTRFAAAALGESFRDRSTRKFYWALVAGVPKPKQGRISTFLAKEERVEDSVMRIAEHGEEGASHAVTYYAVVETAAQKLAWLSLKPVTGRTHQLRAHMAHIGHPIVGDPKYFNIENWEFPGGLQNKLHLLARRIIIPHPRFGVIDVSAPLPDHMLQSWNLLGFDAKRYDPIEDAPDEN